MSGQSVERRFALRTLRFSGLPDRSSSLKSRPSTPAQWLGVAHRHAFILCFGVSCGGWKRHSFAGKGGSYAHAYGRLESTSLTQPLQVRRGLSYPPLRVASAPFGATTPGRLPDWGQSTPAQVGASQSLLLPNLRRSGFSACLCSEFWPALARSDPD